MAKLVYGLSQSLDGYVDHMKLGPPAPAAYRHFIELMRGVTGVIYGRRMYEIMRYWDADDREFAAAWQSQPKWVVSRTLKSAGPNVTLVAEVNGVAMADASAIPMRQNIRGNVYPMAGVAGVATLPLARRSGFARELVTALLARMRDTGHAVSALYPFRPSFYQRFGFVGLPRTRTVAWLTCSKKTC